MTEDNEGTSMISPSLSLVESFDYLDGTKGTLKDKDASGNYIAYTNPNDIFANKDARLYGTIIYLVPLLKPMRLGCKLASRYGTTAITNLLHQLY